MLVLGPERMVETQDGPGRKVVLVVEDEQAIGELIARAVSEEPGYTAIHVKEPGAAIETTKQVTPDVIVVDVRLPGMSGFEFYDRVRKDPRTRDVPVLFETGIGAESLDELRRRGIATYVQKPFDLNDVVAYVKRLASRRALRASAASASALPRRA